MYNLALGLFEAREWFQTYTTPIRGLPLNLHIILNQSKQTMENLIFALQQPNIGIAWARRR